MVSPGSILIAAPPTFAVGEKAKEDVVASTALVVIDPERTEKLRNQEAQRIASILRFDPQAAADAELALRATFAIQQQSFLNALQKAYRRTKLADSEIETPKFERFVSNFQRQARPFPMTTNLAQVWALGQSDDSLEAELVCRLRETMARYIRPDQLPPEARIGPQRWRLVERSDSVAEVNLKRANSVHRTNVLTKTRVRKELVASFESEDAALARFVAGFVRENCYVDAELTRRLRFEKTNELFAADHYEAGQKIVQAGEIITPRSKAALDKLSEKLAWDEAQRELVHAEAKAETAMASLRLTTDSARRRAWALCIGGLGVGVIGIGLWLVTNRRSRSLALAVEVPLLADAENGAVAIQQRQNLPVLQLWQQRALAAERRITKLTRAMQMRVAPHLARWLAYRFVQQVISNRRQLLEMQRRAASDIAELEQRLTQTHASLQERLRAYESRVVELEAQLQATEQQNRELLEMTISVAREKIEMERVAAGMEWN